MRALVLALVALVPLPALAQQDFGVRVTPEGLEIGLAARWQIVDEFSVMLQYTHVFLGDRVITDSLHRPLTQASLSAFNHPSPTGAYMGSAETIRLGLATHF